MASRLHRHAAKYHGCGNKAHVIRRYSDASNTFGQAATRQHAAHVAAWIAYGPAGLLPDISELQLLGKLVDKMGSGLLPSRLNGVLPHVLAVTCSSEFTSTGEAWTAARDELQGKLRKFRCCRESLQERSALEGSAKKNDAVLATSSILFAESRSGGDGTEEVCVDASGGRAVSPKRLFRKMNEWTNLALAERWLFQ